MTARILDAAWPDWWSAEAEQSRSAQTELRFTLARRLGAFPSSLFDGQPRFVWESEPRFKNLGSVTRIEASVLSSFAVSIGRCLISAIPETHRPPVGIDADELRAAILNMSPAVLLPNLVSTCWGLGIPVVQVRLFPLRKKAMAAVSVRWSDRYAILVGREIGYPSEASYLIAHELGHIAQDHLQSTGAALDIEDPLRIADVDGDEREADRYALELLTGDPDITVEPDSADFNSASVANAVTTAAESNQIDPGILALCMGHATGRWQQVYGALNILGPAGFKAGDYLNTIAAQQLDWPALGHGDAAFLRQTMGLQ